MTDLLIGAHTSNEDPLRQAALRNADLIQMFLSNPNSWKAPLPRDDADELLAADLVLYAHAPYPMNPASPNNRIRIPSRKTLAETMKAAQAIGARGVVVHGGHVGEDEDIAVGYERWRKLFDAVGDWDVPILIENTAGGEHAVVRQLANYGPLWDEIGDYNVGVCLDTCHAWAGGQDLEKAVDLINRLTGSLQLIHCNDSKDPFDSGRDRHENLRAGQIPEELLLGVVRSAGVPVVVETSGIEGQAADIAWLRENV